LFCCNSPLTTKSRNQLVITIQRPQFTSTLLDSSLLFLAALSAHSCLFFISCNSPSSSHHLSHQCLPSLNPFQAPTFAPTNPKPDPQLYLYESPIPFQTQKQEPRTKSLVQTIQPSQVRQAMSPIQQKRFVSNRRWECGPSVGSGTGCRVSDAFHGSGWTSTWRRASDWVPVHSSSYRTLATCRWLLSHSLVSSRMQFISVELTGFLTSLLEVSSIC
jgi:hypothetical protein